MASAKRVMIVGSYAPSLIGFRGDLIETMTAAGHAVTAVASNIDPATEAGLQKLGAESREASFANSSLNPLGLIRSIRELRGLIREEKPDVILAYTIKPVIASAMAARAERVSRIVSLITGAGYAFTSGRELKRFASRIAASALYAIALRRSDVIIFQNPDDERQFRDLRLVPRGGETHVVNGSGVDLARFSPVPFPPRPAFLMIARLLKDKGIHEFVEAAKRLKAADPQAEIILVGDLDPSPNSLSRVELDELIATGIDYRGHLADVRGVIADCAVFVLPSYYREGTPRSILEAMAMGRAIITTDSPGCRETVRDGRNGFLVKPRDSTSLFEAMMRFVREPDLAERMGRASRQLAEEKYDVRKVNADVLRYAGLSSEGAVR